MGEQLHMKANGLDDSPVAVAGENEAVKSVGNGYTFKRDLVSESDFHIAVAYLADSVATRLRKHGFKCRVVQIAIKDTAMKSIVRQTTLAAPTYLAHDISLAAYELLAKHWRVGKPIRALTITGENLVAADEADYGQLTLFDQPSAPKPERQEKLEQTLDHICERYGSKAVIQANILKNDLGIRVKDK
jgi:DNA polymerase-4